MSRKSFPITTAAGLPERLPGRAANLYMVTEGGTLVTFTYHVFGHPETGLAGIAPAVDGVIGEQLQRLGERLARD